MADGQKVKVTGFVFTSKNIFKNALNSYNAHNDEGIILDVDGVWPKLVYRMFLRMTTPNTQGHTSWLYPIGR